jgi:hypothetical protein
MRNVTKPELAFLILVLVVAIGDAVYRIFDGTSILYEIPDPREDFIAFMLVMVTIIALIGLLLHGTELVLKRHGLLKRTD